MRSAHLLRLAMATGIVTAALAVADDASALGWTAGGIPICLAARAQASARVISDGAGGVFIAWTDPRAGAGTNNIYMQHVTSTGDLSPGWPVDGLAICTAYGAQNLNDMQPDGLGNVLVVWDDTRDNLYPDIWAQYVFADGTTAWQANGVPVCQVFTDQHGAVIASDGAGGAFIAWMDSRNPVTQRDIYAMHLGPDGAPMSGWDTDGKPVTALTTIDSSPVIVPDGVGGLYIAWVTDQVNPDVWAQHLGPTGFPAATWAVNGYPVCALPSDQTGVRLVPGAAGSAMAIWRDTRSDVGYYAARFGPTTSFAAGFPANGQLIYANANGKLAPYVASDSAGGALIMWGELVTSTNEDLLSTHITGDGIVITSIDWPTGIVPVCADTSYQDPACLAPDGAGGALAAWTDYRDAGVSLSNPDVYVQHIAADARIATGWPVDGVGLATSPAPESLPFVASDGSGGAIAAWGSGTGNATDLFAGRVGSDGIVPALATLVASDATPERVRLEWSVDAGGVLEASLQRRDETSPWTTLAVLALDGLGRATYEDRAVVPGARYAYRLAITSRTGTEHTAESWVAVPRTAVFALRGVWPNPIANVARVRFALPDADAATLTLLDPQGRVVRRWDAGGLAGGEREMRLEGFDRMPGGIYFLQLSHGSASQVTRVCVTR